MDKKLQKKILKIIRGLNERFEKGIRYNLIKDDFLPLIGQQYSMEKIIQNLRLLVDGEKIEVSDDFFNNFYGNHIPGWARLTIKGYEEFNPLYKKLWIFFTDDMAKILSVIATILSIIAMLIGLRN